MKRVRPGLRWRPSSPSGWRHSAVAGGCRGQRGFVFLATLGVMAVGLLVVFAVSGAVHFGYNATDTAMGEVQERLMVQSAADYALLLLAQNKMAIDGKPQEFQIANDQMRKSVVSGTIQIHGGPGHRVYQSAALAYRPGDVLIHVLSDQMIRRYGRGERYVLCNREGRRGRPIDVTDVLKRSGTE